MLVAHVHHRNDNGDDTIALQCVLNYDLERTQLLEEEARLVAREMLTRTLLLERVI
jgi:hypothetical protein